MSGELAALGAALSWAVSGVLLKALTQRFNPLLLNALRCLPAAAFLWVVWLAVGRATDPVPVTLWAVVGLVGSASLGIGVGDSLYLKGLSLVEVSKGYPVSISVYPIITLIIAATFLGERLTWPMGLGAALVILGVYLVAFPRRTEVTAAAPNPRLGLILVLVATLFWGGSITWLKVAMGEIHPIQAAAVRMTGTSALLLVMAARAAASFRLERVGLRAVALGGLTGIISYGIGGMFFLWAIQRAGAGKATVLGAASPLFLLPLSLVFLKERLSVQLVAGVLVCVAGIWLVSADEAVGAFVRNLVA